MPVMYIPFVEIDLMVIETSVLSQTPRVFEKHVKPVGKLWHVHIVRNKERHCLGSYETRVLAEKAYLFAKMLLDLYSTVEEPLVFKRMRKT